MAATKSAQQSPQEKKVADSKKRAEKFIELATKRVNKAIKTLESVGALSDRRSYIYTSEQYQKVCSALEGATNGVRVRFDNAQKGVAASGFTL